METFLSQTAEYALRAAAWIAAHPEDGPMRAKDLSIETHIPIHYLSKILRRLVVGGVLRSQKGHHGGFVLARDPKEISFEMILKAVDSFPVPGRCTFGWGDCDSDDPCPLHESWSKMSETFCKWASQMNLGHVHHA